MSATRKDVDKLIHQAYPHGFITDIDSESAAPGLNEDVVRFISAKKQEPD